MLLNSSLKTKKSLSQVENVTVFLGAGYNAININYSIVDGLHLQNSFSTKKTSLHTYLTDPKFTNVTGGQVIQIQRDNYGITTVVGGVVDNATVHAQILFAASIAFHTPSDQPN